MMNATTIDHELRNDVDLLLSSLSDPIALLRVHLWRIRKGKGDALDHAAMDSILKRLEAQRRRLVAELGEE